MRGAAEQANAEWNQRLPVIEQQAEVYRSVVRRGEEQMMQELDRRDKMLSDSALAVERLGFRESSVVLSFQDEIRATQENWRERNNRGMRENWRLLLNAKNDWKSTCNSHVSRPSWQLHRPLPKLGVLIVRRV